MNNYNLPLAPVAVFVYNRLNNTKKVFEALSRNYLALKTDVFIFSDAPKTERDEKTVDNVRGYLRKVTGFKSVIIIERKENFYIEKNIIEGVTEIINRYGKIIVLEDDGVTARNFLNYMNDALNFYEDKKKIMHIAGFTFIKIPDDYKKTILWRYSENAGGGWATWKDRWDKFKWFSAEREGLACLSQSQKEMIEFGGVFKCLNNLKANPIPWDICWYIAIVSNNCLAVNPPKSLMKNIGLYNGTHFSPFHRLLGKSPLGVEISEDQKIIFEDNLVENTQAVDLLKEVFMRMSNNKIKKLINYFKINK